MSEYNQKELDELMVCPKEIIESPKKAMKEERGVLRNGMMCRSIDGNHNFSVFMRINKAFQENFSIGLDYLPAEGGTVFLCRFNGPHGDQTSDPENLHPHFGCHIHKADVEMEEAGFKPGKHAVLSKDYITYDEALKFFFQSTNITNAKKYFEKIFEEQLNLFPEGGEEE